MGRQLFFDGPRKNAPCPTFAISLCRKGGIPQTYRSANSANSAKEGLLPNPVPLSIQDQFGAIDIYVFDQILRGNLAAGMRIVDAGCGYGRNLVHLLREGCEIFAVDRNPEGVEHVRRLSASLGTSLP